MWMLLGLHAHAIEQRSQPATLVLHMSSTKLIACVGILSWQQFCDVVSCTLQLSLHVIHGSRQAYLADEPACVTFKLHVAQLPDIPRPMWSNKQPHAEDLYSCMHPVCAQYQGCMEAWQMPGRCTCVWHSMYDTIFQMLSPVSWVGTVVHVYADIYLRCDALCQVLKVPHQHGCRLVCRGEIALELMT